MNKRQRIPIYFLVTATVEWEAVSVAEECEARKKAINELQAQIEEVCATADNICEARVLTAQPVSRKQAIEEVYATGRIVGNICRGK